MSKSFHGNIFCNETDNQICNDGNNGQVFLDRAYSEPCQTSNIDHFAKIACNH